MWLSTYDRTLMLSVRGWMRPLSHVWPRKRCSCPCSRHEYVWGSRGITPLILSLCNRWRWVVGFTPRPLYPEKEPQCFLKRRLGGPHSRSGRLDRREMLVLTGIRTPVRPAPGLVFSQWLRHTHFPVVLMFFLMNVSDRNTKHCKSDVLCPYSFANVVQ
jgi:hypothetical protein